MYSCICFFARLFTLRIRQLGNIPGSSCSWWSTVHPQTTTPPSGESRHEIDLQMPDWAGAKAPAFSSVDQKQCVCRGGGRVILCERLVDTT